MTSHQSVNNEEFTNVEEIVSATDDCNFLNTDDFAISPVEGYSEVKTIPSPYSKVAHVDSSDESSSVNNIEGSEENLMDFNNDKISASVASEKKFSYICGKNETPQWKKDLILRKKNNLAKNSINTENPMENLVPIKSQKPTIDSEIISPSATDSSISFNNLKSPVIAKNALLSSKENSLTNASLNNKLPNLPSQNFSSTTENSSNVLIDSQITTAIDSHESPSFNKKIESCIAIDGKPVNFISVKSVANKYNENILLKSPTTPTSSSKSISKSSTSSPSSSIVKTIVGELTCKGQYTNGSNNMIDSLAATFQTKIEKSTTQNLKNNNTKAAIITTTLTSNNQMQNNIGNMSSRFGNILHKQDIDDDNDKNKIKNKEINFFENEITTETPPPIPKRRTSLINKQKTCNNMATTLQQATENEKNLLEVQLHQRVQQQNNKKIPDEVEITEQQFPNLLLQNQLHSRHEYGKVGSRSFIDEVVINKSDKILKSPVKATSNNNKLREKEISNEILNASQLPSTLSSVSNDNDSFDEDSIDEPYGLKNVAFKKNDNCELNSAKYKRDFVNLPLLKNNNKLFDEKSLKKCGNILPTSNLSNIKNSIHQSSTIVPSILSSSSVHQPQQQQHKGYNKNPTANKNSTAIINKYIAAAAAKNQNITSNSLINNNTLQKNSKISHFSTSPKKENSFLNATSPVAVKQSVARTAKIIENKVSSLPSPTSTFNLVVNNKQNFVDNSIIDSKMVAVQETQLNSTTNGEPSSSTTSSLPSNNGELAAVNLTKNTGKLYTASPQTNNVNSANNSKRTKMINHVKTVQYENIDEFNDFDPSEELQYGPGIVSKLRCRYLSLALRQSTGKSRLPLDNLRRATSLNNLLDSGPGTNGTTNVNKINGTSGTGGGVIITTTVKTKIIHQKNGNTIINDMIDESDDYEHLIISSSTNHSNYGNRNQLNGITTKKQSGTDEQDTVNEENSCSKICVDDGIGVEQISDDDSRYVEKPDQQEQNNQNMKINSVINSNKKLNTSASPLNNDGKSSNIANKTGCLTNFDNQQQIKNNLIQQQYVRNTTTTTPAATGLIRSGRQIKRGNDSIKRARSVEALLYEKPDICSSGISVNNVPTNDSDDKNKNGGVKNEINLMSASAHAALHWNTTNDGCGNSSNISTSLNTSENGSTEVTIEDKIANAREHRKYEKHPPKRLTSIIDDTERPPPDVVKQTLKIFEASANRRNGRGLSKNHHGGQVAAKVANYKSIISQDQKPPISHPKPPLSPKRFGVNLANGATVNSVSKLKPNNLNIQNVSNNATKYNKTSPRISSPVSNLTKRFNSQISEENSNNNETKPLVPLTGIASPTTLGIGSSNASYFKNRTESPTSRITPEVRTPEIPLRNNIGSSTLNEGIQPVSMSTPNSSFVDSPVTHLTKKFDRLKLETPPLPPSSSPSTITSASPTTSAIIQTGIVTANPAKTYQRSKSSDSELSTDNETENEGSYDVSRPLYDDDDDSIDGDGEMIVKKISKTALENISKAGSSQCFSFKNVKTTPLIGINTKNLSAEQTTSSQGIKQVGIIRPLVAEPKTPTLSTIDTKSNEAPIEKLKQSAIATTSSDSDEAIKSESVDEQKSPPQPLKRTSIGNIHGSLSPGSSFDNSVIENDIEDDQTLVISGISQTSQKPALKTENQTLNSSNKINTNSNNVLETVSQDNSNVVKPALTSREIEKNLINEKKNELANLELAAAAASVIGNNSINELNNWQQQLSQKKKNSSATIEASNNIMVFNFKDRKEVPDYIENDGLFIRRKRELPKPNESGFVLLGDLTLETSTDPDDSWIMGPPSPCNVEFENANIIIDGKSSLRYRSKDGSLRVQFNDTLTSTFEYPSETSLLDEYVVTPTDTFYTSSNQIDTLDSNSSHHVPVEEIIPIIPIQSSTTSSNHNKSLGNMPIDNQNNKQQHFISKENPQLLMSTATLTSYTTTFVKATTTTRTTTTVTEQPELQQELCSPILTPKKPAQIQIYQSKLSSIKITRPSKPPPPIPTSLTLTSNLEKFEKTKPVISSKPAVLPKSLTLPVKKTLLPGNSLTEQNSTIKLTKSSSFPSVKKIDQTKIESKLTFVQETKFPSSDIPLTTSVKSRILQFQKLESESAQNNKRFLSKSETPKRIPKKINIFETNKVSTNKIHFETNKVSSTIDTSETKFSHSTHIRFYPLVADGTELVV